MDKVQDNEIKVDEVQDANDGDHIPHDQDENKTNDQDTNQTQNGTKIESKMTHEFTKNETKTESEMTHESVMATITKCFLITKMMIHAQLLQGIIRVCRQ